MDAESARLVLDAGVLLISVGSAAGTVLYARTKAIRGEQRTQDRLESLEEWKSKHEEVANEGMETLTRLKAGMSEGAEAGFARVEKTLDKIAEVTQSTASQLAQLVGQVKAIAELQVGRRRGRSL